jgi:hypothetical protein
MADVLPFSRNATFDTDATHVMGEAFDRACHSLHDIGQPALVREIIARRIIEVARNGERDPDEMCARALKALGFSHSGLISKLSNIDQTERGLKGHAARHGPTSFRLPQDQSAGTDRP